MSPESSELAQLWIVKARSDLATARLLVTGGEKHFDTGTYHCQQSAEKALKAWLTTQEIVFPKTHSLEDLLALCVPSTPAFAGFQTHAEELSPLATAYRYPGDASEPDSALANRALALAGEICRFCEQQMTGEQE